MDVAILNKAMGLAMEWGPAWMQPTQPRLRKLYPVLNDTELDEYDAAARAAMEFGHGYVYDHPDCTEPECSVALKAGFPWVSEDNLAQVYGQGWYYAYKDGLITRGG